MFAPFRYTASILAILVGTIAFGGETPRLQTPKDRLAELKLLSEGYLSHREKFPHIVCRFQITVGNARRGQDGDKYVFLAPVVGQGRWCVAGEKELYEVKCDPSVFEAAKRAAGNATSFTVPLDSRSVVSGKEWAGSYSPSLQSLNIFSTSVSKPSGHRTPLSMSVMGDNDVLSPGGLYRECEQGRLTCTAVGSDKVGALEYPTISTGDKPNETKRKYWLDPQRGFLPVRCSLYDPEKKRELARVTWSDFRPVGDGRWFPWRAVDVYDPEGQATSPSVIELVVQSLDVTRVPTDDDFTFEIAKGTVISDPTKPATSFRINASRTVRLSDLPGLHEQGKQSLAKRLADRAAMTVPGDTPSWRPRAGVITAIAVGSLLVLGAGYRFIRRRARKNGVAPEAG